MAGENEPMLDDGRALRTPGRGFTLIELLIVVAIISILASIAMPNFLEAQVRARVSRAKADMRTLALGLEIYCVDYGWYPHDDWGDENQSWKQLTTPIAYLGTIFPDPFSRERKPFEYSNSDERLTSGTQGQRVNQNAAYRGAGLDWIVFSRGPDLTITWDWNNNGNDGDGKKLLEELRDAIYDPTNGTVAKGDVFRTSRGQEE
jgi:prepilin-type N-terminal cleavage/methylation domain-containing protein